MLEKVDIRDVVRDHFRTLVSYNTQRPSVLDYLLFYGIPGGISAIAIWSCIQLSDNAINLLINALAILKGFLFNLLDHFTV